MIQFLFFYSFFDLQKKHSRVKLLDSDDEEEDKEPENERDQIAHDIFDQEDDDDDVQSTHSAARSTSRQSERYTAVVDVGEGSDEGEEIDDFIVDDDDQPIKKAKSQKRKILSGKYTDRYVNCKLEVQTKAVDSHSSLNKKKFVFNIFLSSHPLQY